MPKFIMYCGLPGIGKSTHIQKNYIQTRKVIETFDITTIKLPTNLVDSFIKNIVLDICQKYKIRLGTVNISADKFFILSADDIRMSIYNEPWVAELEPLVWATREYILTYLIYENQNIIIDETNLTKKRRANSLKLLLKLLNCYSTYEVICNVFEIHNINDFLKQKHKSLSAELIKQKYDQFEPPELSEGFTRIDHIPHT